MFKRSTLRAGLVALALMTTAVAPGVSAAPPLEVVTSIKPLALLVRAVAPEGTRITTLVPPGQSPHTYALKPSQRQALAGADLVVWVGPGLEAFLRPVLDQGALSARVLTLAPDLEDHAHDGHDEKEATEDGEEDGTDPHLWVDPTRALSMAGDIRRTLAALPDQDPAVLEQRFSAFSEALKQQDDALRQALRPVNDVSLFAYHTAFVGFARHYQLSLAGVLTLNPELSPGARHVAEIRSQLASTRHPCLLTEPQFNPRWWHAVTDGLPVIQSHWDPLATEAPDTANGYLVFQKSIADAVLACLPEQAEH
ncbi:zinc ABC transporter substrate-binding protein [Marinobacter sp. C2H3]|uniref:zinc ABC transporter substrate-binding protein n=1 Tax=Marinobacter sp. C2H3 TaxID=3119003 RepID=UPI00300E9F4B